MKMYALHISAVAKEELECVSIYKLPSDIDAMKEYVDHCMLLVEYRENLLLKCTTRATGTTTDSNYLKYNDFNTCGLDWDCRTKQALSTSNILNLNMNARRNSILDTIDETWYKS